jgi:hypothetical protein
MSQRMEVLFVNMGGIIFYGNILMLLLDNHVRL